MTIRIDFYVLKNQDSSAWEQFACRLTHKAYQLGHRICLLALDKNQAKRLDQLLWTFNANSFIPHALEGEQSSSNAPIVISSQSCNEKTRDILITLGEAQENLVTEFERVAEVVGGPEDGRKKARERYRFYREKGYDLQTHDV